MSEYLILRSNDERYNNSRNINVSIVSTVFSVRGFRRILVGSGNCEDDGCLIINIGISSDSNEVLMS